MRLTVLALLMILFSSLTTPSIAPHTGHGCAFPTPPSVPGTVSPPATAGVVVINEILLYPHSTWNCTESGAYFLRTDSWLELYNPQSQPFDLYAVHATLDSGPQTNAYYLPFGAAIPAHGYLVLFPRTDGSFNASLTSTFRLLIAGVVIDEITVPQLGNDQSYARTSDAAPTWQITSTPTIDASNTPQLAPTPTAPSTSATSTTTSTSSHGRNSRSSGGSSDDTGANPHTPLVSGTQPPWGSIQLPSTPVDTQGTDTLSPSALPSSPAQNTSPDILPRLGFTLLSIIVAAAIFLGIRIFSKRSP